MIERREFLKKIALLAGVMGGGALLPASGKAADQEVGIAIVEGESMKGIVQASLPLPFLCLLHPCRLFKMASYLCLNIFD